MPKTFLPRHHLPRQHRIYLDDGTYRVNDGEYNASYDDFKYDVQFPGNVLAVELHNWILENIKGRKYSYVIFEHKEPDVTSDVRSMHYVFEEEDRCHICSR